MGWGTCEWRKVGEEKGEWRKVGTCEWRKVGACEWRRVGTCEWRRVGTREEPRGARIPKPHIRIELCHLPRDRGKGTRLSC